MVRVLATGTFDILHPGHIFYLEEAKKLGDELYVIVARDVNVKKRAPIIPEEQRLKMVASLKIVNKAVLGSEKDIFEPLYEIKPDIVALGYDQNFDERELERELRRRGFNTKVVRLGKCNSYPFCSSKDIIKEIIRRSEGGLRGRRTKM